MYEAAVMHPLLTLRALLGAAALVFCAMVVAGAVGTLIQMRLGIRRKRNTQ